jgi:hypothetical protein
VQHYYTDPDGNTYTLEVPDPEPSPLDPVGALATLLVVTGTLDLTEAAAVVQLPETALIAEAEAWAIGAP